MPGCKHRSTGLIHSADGAARGDLGLQDGRRRLVEVVVWVRRKPGHPPPSARGKPGRPSPGGWADGDLGDQLGRHVRSRRSGPDRRAVSGSSRSAELDGPARAL